MERMFAVEPGKSYNSFAHINAILPTAVFPHHGEMLYRSVGMKRKLFLAEINVLGWRLKVVGYKAKEVLTFDDFNGWSTCFAVACRNRPTLTPLKSSYGVMDMLK